jgi:hypothetical protein
MPLNFTGKTAANLSWTSLEAEDAATGARVIVKVTHEAEQDHGFLKAKEVASAKYDRSQLEPDGVVMVRTADCA